MHAEIFAPCFNVRSTTSGFVRKNALVTLAAVAALTLAGCASRMSPAPITDLTQASPATSTPTATGKTYTVRQGDTLYKIAQSTGVDVGTLISLNQITDPSHLKIGQTLRLDGSAT